MKSLICSIAIILCSFILQAQTYPVGVAIANAPSQIGLNNAFKGKLILTTFTDTTAANAEGFLKNYDGALIKTTTPIIAIWYRDLAHTIWVQILPAGGGSGGLNVWLVGGNNTLTVDGSSNAAFGANSNAGIYFRTNGLTRMLLDKGGIIRSSGAANKFLTIDTVTHQLYYGDGGSGSTPTWQQTLTAGSTLNTNNVINGVGHNLTFNLDTIYVTEFIKGVGWAGYIDFSNGDINAENTGTSIRVQSRILQDENGIESVNWNDRLLVDRNGTNGIGWADTVFINPHLGSFTIDTLTNLSAQNTLMGWTSTTGANRGKVGYITLGSGLSLDNAVLTATGTTSGIGSYIDSIANVLDYGAVGDGVTEDSAAFKAAIATGKTVYVPKGIYLNNTVGGLQLNVGQTIFGDGGKQSEIITTTNGTDAYASMYSIIITNTRSEIRGLYFKGTGYGTFSGTYSTQNGIQIMDESSLITGCYFSHLRGAGVLGMYYNGSSFAAKDWNLISDCHFDSCAIGIYNYQSNNYTNMADNMIYRCNYGILNNVSNATVNGGVIELCDYGFYSYEGDRGTVSNVHINHSNTYNVYIYGTTNGYNISNCTFFYGSLYLSNADRTVFDNCGLATNGNITVTGTGTPQVVSFNNGYYANTNNWIISGTGKVIKTGLIDAGVANYNIVADSIKNTGKVSIIDGTQGAGKVFVSDANGVGTWTTSAAPSLTSTYVGYGIGGVLSGSSKLTFDNADLLTLTGGTNGLITVDNPGSGVSRLKLSNQSGYYAIQDLSTGGDYYMLMEGYGTERIRITHSNGYVGINTATPTSQFTVSGSFATAYVAKSADYTATGADNVIEVTATGKTITLPTAVGIQGRIYTIKLTASGSGTVATTSSENIDGSTTYSLASQYKYVSVQSNNVKWIVIANN